MLGLVLVSCAFVIGTVTVRAGVHDCGTADSAHTPAGQFARPAVRSAAEDQCDGKITGRRRLTAVVGIVGLALALGGAYSHERRA